MSINNYQKMKISTFLSVFALVATAYSNPEQYLPIFKFDRSQSEFCYPDYPSSQNNSRCVKNLNQNAPVFYEVDTCNGQTVYTYWLGMAGKDLVYAILTKGMEMIGNAC